MKYLRVSTGTWKYVVLLVVVVLAGFMRLSYLELVEFKADEAIAFFSGMIWWKNMYVVQTGMGTSVGLPNFPLFTYVIGVLWAWGKTPLVVSGMVGVFNTMAVGLFFWYLQKHKGWRVALFSSLVLAAAPRAVLYSRKIWAQDLMAPLVILWWGAWWKWKNRPEAKKWLLGWGVLSAWLVQIHISGLVWLVASSVWWGEKKLFKKDYLGWLITGGVAGMLPGLPYLFGLIRSWFGAGVKEYAIDERALVYDNSHLGRPWRMLSWSWWEYVLGWENFARFWNRSWLARVAEWIALSQIGLLVWSMFLGVKKRGKGIEGRIFVSLILYSVLLYALKVPAHPHYYAVVLPFIAYWFGWGVDQFWQRTRFVAGGYLAILVVMMVVFWGDFMAFLAIKPVEAGDYYGPVLRDTDRQVEEVVQGYQDYEMYDELVAFMYVYAWHEDISTAMVDFFLQAQDCQEAIKWVKDRQDGEMASKEEVALGLLLAEELEENELKDEWLEIGRDLFESEDELWCLVEEMRREKN